MKKQEDLFNKLLISDTFMQLLFNTAWMCGEKCQALHEKETYRVIMYAEKMLKVDLLD